MAFGHDVRNPDNFEYRTHRAASNDAGTFRRWHQCHTGCAVMTKVPEDISYGTIDMNVKFVRKIDTSTGLLTARASTVHAGRTMLTVEARVEDAAGKLYAHGSGSFLVYPKQ